MRRAKRAVLVLFAAWLLLVLAVPLTLPTGSVTDLSGRANAIDNSEAIDGMNPLAWAVYMFGDINCHQLAERSFTINGNQMPFCVRDVGIFLGLAVGMAIVVLLSPRFSWLILAALVLPILVDGGVQLTGMYESNNALRLITGTLAGVGASYFLGHFADWSQSAFKR
jgi:uncharacterized membrane protein